MKGAILGFEKVREAFAQVGESVSDLTHEVRSEMGNGSGQQQGGEAAESKMAAGGREPKSEGRKSGRHGGKEEGEGEKSRAAV